MSKATSKVTSKLQVTVPKVIADQADVRPGDALEWEATGASIRVTSARRSRATSSKQRLASFQAATDRIRQRWKGVKVGPSPKSRGWTRDELYFDVHDRHR